jgi:hypothetical protein
VEFGPIGLQVNGKFKIDYENNTINGTALLWLLIFLNLISINCWYTAGVRHFRFNVSSIME